MTKKHTQHAKQLGPDDELQVFDLVDGFRLVRLLTPAALDLESFRMHHCVSDGAYDGGVLNGHTEIYSLRDPKGRPVEVQNAFGRSVLEWARGNGHDPTAWPHRGDRDPLPNEAPDWFEYARAANAMLGRR